jgi:rRNA processing protein Gar1
MTKNNLYIFGCSFSSPYHEETDEYRRYKTFCGGSFPNTWFELLSNKMNLNLINHGIPGAGNDMIFNRVIEQIRTIQKNDVVIIGWSFLSRFMWANHDTRKWINTNFGRNHSVLNGTEDITEQTSNEIVFNRTSDNTFHLYSEVINHRMELINYISDLVGFKVFYWSCDPYVLYSKEIQDRDNKKIVMGDEIYMKWEIDNMIKLIEKNGGERIKEETNQEIFDFHLGVTGHQVMSNLFYNHINR